MKIIPYGRQSIDQTDIDAVVKALTGDYLTQGPTILEFEKRFAEYVGAKYAVAVANGTAALHLGAMALGVTSGTKVITTPITFVASANCVRYCGGEIVFGDIDPNTLLLDLNHVRSILEGAPKGSFQGIIPVDFAGYPINAEAFRQLADEFGVWIMEDACHAPGAFFRDSNGTQQLSGNGVYADLTVFSFHPVKHIACGEGGMITTNNKELYDRLMMLRTHGITRDPAQLTENHGGWYYEMQELGYNYRLTDIQSALGITQLMKAPAGLARRHQIASRYDRAFNGKLKYFAPQNGESHAYHLYIIEVDNRKMLYDTLKSRGIYAQIHYIPVHSMPYYQKLGHKKGSMPIAEKYYERCLSLPMYPALTDEEQDFVIETVLNNFNKS